MLCLGLFSVQVLSLFTFSTVQVVPLSRLWLSLGYVSVQVFFVKVFLSIFSPSWSRLCLCLGCTSIQVCLCQVIGLSWFCIYKVLICLGFTAQNMSFLGFDLSRYFLSNFTSICFKSLFSEAKQLVALYYLSSDPLCHQC